MPNAAFSSLTKTALIGALCLALAACQTARSVNSGGPLNTAMEDNGPRQSLSTLEGTYRAHNNDAAAATNYAQGLRQSGDNTRADLVLAPFANDSKAPPSVYTEYAAIQLALGQNEKAEKYAKKAVAADPKNARAWHFMGIAQDAQGDHKEAEQAFRKALNNWGDAEGDPTPIMNNLALNLAAQEHLDEAADILTRARQRAPDKIELERNLRIVTALQQSAGRTAPIPPERPDDNNH